MKIASETPQRLHVRHVPWFLRGLFVFFGLTGIVGGLFSAEVDTILMRAFIVAMGIGALGLGWWATPTLDLVMDRTARTVVIRESRLTGMSEQTFPLVDARAVLQAHHDDGARLIRLALEVNGEVVPLEKGYGSVNRDPIAAEINRWLEGRPSPPQPAVVKT